MSTGAKQYHGKRGVAYYLEFPAPDDLHFDMMSNVSALAHYSSAVPKIVVDGTSFVIQRLACWVRNLKVVLSAQSDNPTASVMFHSYLGRNRSAAALLAFVHWVFIPQGDAIPSMETLLLLLAVAHAAGAGHLLPQAEQEAWHVVDKTNLKFMEWAREPAGL